MTERTSVLIKKMPHAEDLPLPRYASELASGIDLFAALEES